MPATFTNVRIFSGSAFRDGPGTITIDGPGDEHIDGGVVFPGFADAHVHLAFSDATAVARGGVTSVLDLGAPSGVAFGDHAPLRADASGPLLTAPGGYPTRSWGADGFGLEIDGPDAARRAVRSLVARGARVVKIAIEPSEGPTPDDATIRAAADEAHAARTPVAVHALGASSVRRALACGADVLAHTPLERLPEDLAGEIGARRTWVVSTVRAFGASAEAHANLRALTRAGCRIAYGTDLGNGAIAPGIDAGELRIVADALGSEEAALAAASAATTTLCPRAARGDVVWVERYRSIDDLAGPKRVWIGGTEIV